MENKIENKAEDIIRNTAIDAAKIEKLGAALLSFGYATFIEASNKDILEALDANNTGIRAIDIIIFGQKFTVVGYILLYIAASKRLYEKTLANLEKGETNDLSAFQTIRGAYVGSITLNYLRLIEFYKT